MNEVSTLRLYLMRAMYLLLAVGLGSMMWPRIIEHGRWEQMEGVAYALLAALSGLAILGVRYPLRLLPLLLFELFWKVLWLLGVALPLWRANQLDAANMETVGECVPGVVLCLLVIPWPYVWRHYVRARGERWRRSRSEAVSPA